MKRTQAEIVADLIHRAELLEQSAGNPDIKHSAANRMSLRVAARALRVAAEQNSEDAKGTHHLHREGWPL